MTALMIRCLRVAFAPIAVWVVACFLGASVDPWLGTAILVPVVPATLAATIAGSAWCRRPGVTS